MTYQPTLYASQTARFNNEQFKASNELLQESSSSTEEYEPTLISPIIQRRKVNKENDLELTSNNLTTSEKVNRLQKNISSNTSCRTVSTTEETLRMSYLKLRKTSKDERDKDTIPDYDEKEKINNHYLMHIGHFRDFDPSTYYSFNNFTYVKIGNKNQLLGYGAFGEVFCLNHNNENRKYAIKTMNKAKLISNNVKFDIIKKEINIHKRLDHPYIISLKNFKETKDEFHIILEYAKNGSLYSKIKKMKNGFSEDSAFKYFIQTCSALYFLQKNNLVHRDLKPENLLLDENNNIKLSDFGWCEDFTSNTLTQTCGTYEYMAPEIILERPYNEKVDNWALGVLLYELLHGLPPFHLPDLYKDKLKVKLLFEKIVKNSYTIREDLSEEVKDLIKRKILIIYIYLLLDLLHPDPEIRLSIKGIFNHPWVSSKDTNFRVTRKTNTVYVKPNSLLLDNPMLNKLILQESGKKNKSEDSIEKKDLFKEVQNDQEEDNLFKTMKVKKISDFNFNTTTKLNCLSSTIRQKDMKKPSMIIENIENISINEIEGFDIPLEKISTPSNNNLVFNSMRKANTFNYKFEDTIKDRTGKKVLNAFDLTMTDKSNQRLHIKSNNNILNILPISKQSSQNSPILLKRNENDSINTNCTNKTDVIYSKAKAASCKIMNDHVVNTDKKGRNEKSAREIFDLYVNTNSIDDDYKNLTGNKNVKATPETKTNGKRKNSLVIRSR